MIIKLKYNWLMKIKETDAFIIYIINFINKIIINLSYMNILKTYKRGVFFWKEF